MCLGIPGMIIEITDADRQMALVEVSGVRRAVNVACVADGPLEGLLGRWALVHVGFAMSVIDEEEARATLLALETLGEARETLEAMAAGDRALEAQP